MAITESFEVTVLVGGIPLPEFDVPPNEARHYQNPEQTTPNTIQRLVEVENDQLFSIRSRVRIGYRFTTPSIQHFVWFDGSPAYIFHSTPTNRAAIVDGNSAMDGGRLVKRPFKFAPLELNDDTHVIDSMGSPALGIGSIIIQFWPASSIVSTPTRIPQAIAHESAISISEQAIKGRPIDLRIGSGDGQPMDQRPYEASSHRVSRQPLATFKTIYRTKRALELMDVVLSRPAISDGQRQQSEASNTPMQEGLNTLETLSANFVKRSRQEDDEVHKSTFKRLKREPSTGAKAEILVNDSKHEQEGFSGGTSTAEASLRNRATRGQTIALLGSAPGDPASPTSRVHDSENTSTAAKQEVEP
ncbi:hypothetical protein OHC33_002682 [Knufia fluminis]|uniref:DUF7918 domain-containing protein n=1 Tax=Knufia fluminis TaxID=191047 RepID=A0AAN8EHZ7_9EURO|nr:hypothetical protein OHC33_002682 [Knufia fluminis]